MKNRELLEECGARLRTRRKDLGLDIEDVARWCGVSVSAVSQWERGKTEPTADKRPKLAKVLEAELFSHVYYGHGEVGG